MFQNSKINIIYRLICLLSFVFVIVKVNSFITLSLLTIAFYLFTKSHNNLLLFWLHVITFIVYIISFITNNYIILRIILIIGLSYYFLFTNYEVRGMISSGKKVSVDKYFIRFKEHNNRKVFINNNLDSTYYITVHLLILFITIMVG